MAIRQPSLSSPIRFSRGTRTLSKNTSASSSSFAMVRIGRAVMPGDFMSIRMNEMPACFTAAGSVRTRANIQSA